MPERKVSDDFGVLFRPGSWTPLECFKVFVGQPFANTLDLQRGVNAVRGNLYKFEILAGLANQLAEDLHLDNDELFARGHSAAIRSKEYAAVVEALVATLYSVLDGLRRTLFGCFANVRGVQNKFNSKMFKRAEERKYGEGFPEPIRAALAEAYAAWFKELRRIRTELTHGENGRCYLDSKTGKIFYTNSGLGSATKAHVIEDVPTTVSDMQASVSDLTQNVFSYLVAQLVPSEKQIACGTYRGRVYARRVALTPDITFHSGVCASREWFDKPDEYDKCPLRGICGAYARVGPPPPGDRPAPLIVAPPEKLFELTQKLAYQMWEGRGRPLWDDHRDWFEAELRLVLI